MLFRSTPVAGPLPADAVPPGVRELAVVLLDRAARALDELDGTGWVVDHELADGHLVLPHVVAAANGLDAPEPPPAPRPAPGGGWVAVDLGPDDEDTFRTLCTVLDDEVRAGAPAPDAEAFARRAQEWRLAVTPYRAGPGAASGPLRDGPADRAPATPPPRQIGRAHV